MQVSALGNLTKKLNPAYLKLYHSATTASRRQRINSNFRKYSVLSNGCKNADHQENEGRNMRMTIGLGVLTALAFVGGPASGTTTTQTFQVQLTIQAQCVINSTATLNFGSLGVLGGASGTTNNDQNTTVAVQCTNTTPYDIGLDAGTTAGGSTTTRLLVGTSSSATVQYKLYTDPGHATNWGNTVGTDTVHTTGNGASQSHTIYGRIPPQTTPKPDTYSDTVTVTVTY
jgi:spore coat protein U-like protein